ncbi:MAG: Post-segregation antitoxin (ccd killing mechanism protein) encoded by the plasmid [Rubritepida sp.]|nr:Post-segregation antitoxin (ccd killing mechanism protein) encoded by the plasmid [Rubritepida sp.]
MRDPVLSRAIEMAGGVNALARKLGITSASVAQWRSVPPARVGEVARVTGLQPSELRPDLRLGFAEAQAPFAAEAQALGLNAAAIAAQAVQDAIRAEKARRWLEENREAIDAWNRWTEENGLPLAEYRMF